MKTCPIIILCIIALSFVLLLAILLFFFYKNGERLTKANLEYRRLDQEEKEQTKKVTESYRRLYLDGLKEFIQDEKLEDKKKQEYRDTYLKELKHLGKISE